MYIFVKEVHDGYFRWNTCSQYCDGNVKGILFADIQNGFYACGI